MTATDDLTGRFSTAAACLYAEPHCGYQGPDGHGWGPRSTPHAVPPGMAPCARLTGSTAPGRARIAKDQH